jgi:tripartite ATP-independent transporter DctM subunit
MLRAKYDEQLSAGVICAGGTLGILIPPSIMLIVYSATSSVSVVKLYAAAMLPGFLLAGLYVSYVIVVTMIKPQLAPKLPKEETNVPWLRVLLLLLQAFFPLAVLIMSVLGSILFGLATPTEAASVGAFGAMVLAAAYRALTLQRLREAVYLTARTSAMVCFLFVGSWTFSSIFSYLGGEGAVKAIVLSLNLNSITFLLLSQFIIFLLGWPLEWSEIIIIFVPIFLPLLPHFNVDPLFFGILVALNLQTSFLTPPMAMSAYYLKGIAPPHIQLWTIFRGCFPFLSMVFVTMAAIYIFPQLVFWLPGIFYSLR